MTDTLPTDLMISAKIRLAAREGVPMTVVHKGDPSSGVIYLKINRLDGTADVLSQVRIEDKEGWMSASNGQPMPERDADAYLTEQTSFDPDLWVIEIEDRQGRHWFDGPIFSL